MSRLAKALNVEKNPGTIQTLASLILAVDQLRALDGLKGESKLAVQKQVEKILKPFSNLHRQQVFSILIVPEQSSVSVSGSPDSLALFLLNRFGKEVNEKFYFSNWDAAGHFFSAFLFIPSLGFSSAQVKKAIRVFYALRKRPPLIAKKKKHS